MPLHASATQRVIKEGVTPESHTCAAACRLRIPVRIEPKTFFALERTYLSWMHMAVTLGGVTSALVGFSYSEASVRVIPSQAGSGTVMKRSRAVVSRVDRP